MQRETRDRKRPLKVVVSDRERVTIKARAQSTKLSVSAYLRAAGLDHPIQSTLDHAAILELAEVNGDRAASVGC